VAEGRLHARTEVPRGALHLRQLFEGGLVVEGMPAVQGEQDHHELVHGAREAGGRPVDVRARRELLGEAAEPELRRPQVVAHQRLAKGLGVDRHAALERGEP